jgi:hypothetical protein
MEQKRSTWNKNQQMLNKKTEAGYNGIASLQLILGTASRRYKDGTNSP